MSSDTERLRFLMTKVEGFGTVDRDRYDFADAVAEEEGHAQPTAADELEGFRRLIDVAMADG